jgi:adenosylmethionine-8-amino-7-oxononanoate transaminase
MFPLQIVDKLLRVPRGRLSNVGGGGKVSTFVQLTRSHRFDATQFDSPMTPISIQIPIHHHHWHGFTAMADYEPMTIRRAQGCYLETDDGRQIFDGVSSMWCNVHGHNHPHINAAIRSQLDQVAHVTSLGMSCEATENLALKLAEITPGDLAHTFFSSDGSSAIEAALKMAFQYWQQCPDPRPEKTEFLALGSAYHGDTTGAVSLGGIDTFHRMFGPMLFRPIRGPLPCTTRYPVSVPADDLLDYYASQLARLIEQHQSTLAAVVIEPLVQGAAGMVTHPAGLLAAIRDLCDRFDVLLICDEVATGFGRTGRMFACQHEDVTPDILCLGKGLTGGYLPMAATIARPMIFDAFLAPSTSHKQFFHGHTFGGNPLAAAAALASLELFEETDWLNSAAQRAHAVREKLSVLDRHPHVCDVRGRGLMIGIEMVADRKSLRSFPSHLKIGHRVCAEATRRGCWIRPIGDVLIAMPPMVSSHDQLQWMADVILESIDHVLADPEGA